MRWPVVIILWAFLLLFRVSSILALKVRPPAGRLIHAHCFGMAASRCLRH